MTRYVALLRGINVGGSRKIAMSDLRSLLYSLGHSDVSTYLQSGNALFTSSRTDTAEMEREIERRIESDLVPGVRVLLRTPEELAAAIAGNPFEAALANPKIFHVAFLSAQPQPEKLSQIDPRRFEPDQFSVGDRVVYLAYATGAGRTKLTNNVFERLGVVATSRNWNTVTTLYTLATE